MVKLALTVLEYHSQFDIAIQKFSTVSESITDSQNSIKDIRNYLESSQQTLESKKFDFLHLWVKSLQYKEMARILDLIVELNDIKLRIDLLMNEKSFLQAVRVLVQAEKIIYSNDLGPIDALSVMREQFFKIKDQLQDKLILELNNHIYLKTKESLLRIGQEV